MLLLLSRLCRDNTQISRKSMWRKTSEVDEDNVCRINIVTHIHFGNCEMRELENVKAQGKKQYNFDYEQQQQHNMMPDYKFINI